MKSACFSGWKKNLRFFCRCIVLCQECCIWDVSAGFRGAPEVEISGGTLWWGSGWFQHSGTAKSQAGLLLAPPGLICTSVHHTSRSPMSFWGWASGVCHYLWTRLCTRSTWALLTKTQMRNVARSPYERGIKPQQASSIDICRPTPSRKPGWSWS